MMRRTIIHTAEERVLLNGKFIQVIERPFTGPTGKRGLYEVVKRNTFGRIVVIAAVTERGELLLERNFRVPMNDYVIELPAGLADKPGESDVALARRELREETGYTADTLIPLAWGPTTAGLTDEEVIVFYAPNVYKTQEPEHEDGEDIEVIQVPLKDVSAYLARASADGKRADLKIYATLWKLQELLGKKQ